MGQGSEAQQPGVFHVVEQPRIRFHGLLLSLGRLGTAVTEKPRKDNARRRVESLEWPIYVSGCRYEWKYPFFWRWNN
jgi:hypothetical protein